MLDKKLKKVSIKFGIICGMLITALSVFNATMDSIQKWNETFKKPVVTEEFFIEQRITGTPPPGTSISKSLSTESFLEEGAFDESPSSPIEEKNSWFTYWFVFMLVGIFVWAFSFYLGRRLGAKSYIKPFSW